MDKSKIPVIICPSQATKKEGIFLAEDIIEEVASQSLTQAKGMPVDALCVVNILSKHKPNPANTLSNRLGIQPKFNYSTSIGGNTPQYLVNYFAKKIKAGEINSALIAGAEAMRSSKEFQRLREINEERPKTKSREEIPATGSDELIGELKPGVSDRELLLSIITPVQIYPFFESAMANRNKITMKEARLESAQLFSPFTKIASQDSYAWFQEFLTPEEIADISPENRLVSEPYTKRLCAFLGVDQGAAFIVSSLEMAEKYKVADKCIYPIAAGDLNDVWNVTNRPNLDRSVAMEYLAQNLLASKGITADDIAFFDFYSCFPCAVKFAANALGLKYNDSRGFTITGGLPYFGGPGNNYVSHSIAKMVELLIENDGLGLITGLGWYMTKHSWGIYCSKPDKNGFVSLDTSDKQKEIDATEIPYFQPQSDKTKEALVVASTVTYNNNGEISGCWVIAETDHQREILRVEDDISSLEDKNLAGYKVILTGNFTSCSLK